MRLFSFAAVIYGGIFALLYGAQDRLLYAFDPAYVTPKAAGEPRLTEHKLKTPDGETLIVWSARAKGNSPTLLYFHGNVGNLALRAERFDRLLDRGYGLVALGFRGSSGSTGSPSEETLIADANLMRASLKQLLGRRPKGKVVYFGESLGTGAAIALAVDQPPDALMLEAPYTSIVNIVRERLPIYPVDGFIRDEWNNLERIEKVKAPLFVIHGTADSVVPFDHGKAIVNAAQSRKKVFEIREGEDHFKLWSIAGQKAMYRFLDRL